MQEKKINNLVINKVENQQTYEKMKTQGLINNDELYLVGGGTEVTSVNGQTGDVNLTAEDVNALSKDTKIPSKTSDLTNDSGYLTTLPVATSNVLGGVKSGGDFTVNSSTGAVTIKHQSLADYAKTADVNTSLNGKVPTTRKINNKALSADITLSASDISGTVRYDTASQGLTTTQKANARTNIGAGTSSFSGSYNDLTNKPTIPSAITESTVSGWGFTKNTGTYSKPSNGIPKSDLASAVQTSLDKADTALQSLPSHTHNYAGSSSAGGAANSVKTNLTIKLNSGATEGTNLFTFNGSTAKSIDITPSTIGAATSDHTHSYLPLSGGELTGNLTGKYITGTWLQTTAVTDKAGKFATIDNDGWIYYRTAAEVATDIGALASSDFIAYTETEIQALWDGISV